MLPKMETFFWIVVGHGCICEDQCQLDFGTQKLPSDLAVRDPHRPSMIARSNVINRVFTVLSISVLPASQHPI